MTTPDQQAVIDRGWSAADVDPSELVDDAWIAAHTSPALPFSRVRHLGQRTLQAVRTIGVDPLEGVDPTTQASIATRTARLPRALRRSLVQSGGLTREQMRRIAARTGYPVVEAWSTRNAGTMRGVWGALIHHTGTAWSAAGDYPTLRVVQQGRSDLQNSLCAFGLGRSGTVYLVSNLLSWHAGAGAWNGCTDGNGYLVGIEAESDGVNWTAEERDAYPRLVASILLEIGQTDPRPGVGDKYTTRHASYALPAGRKTDAQGLDMDLFWRQVYGYLANPASITRGGAPAPVPPPPPAPAPAPAPVVQRPPTFGWDLPAGHYYGNIAGNAKSHGGATAGERAHVRVIQQWLIYRGCVPGVDPARWATSTWADGKWQAATDTAMRTWHSRFYPGQPQPAQCWSDDLRRLTA